MEAAYGTVLLIAIAMSAFSEERDRMSGVLASMLIAASWLLYNAPWHGWGIRSMSGQTLSNTEAWSLGDAMVFACLVAVYILYARQWVAAIFIMLLGQIACYQALDHYGPGSWLAIQGVLDTLFAAMLSIILIIGGKGAAIFLHRRCRFRDIRILR